jgi:hypothetical protein
MAIETYEQELDLDDPGKPIDTFVDDEPDEVELEIVDDTPPEDRNRAPLPEDIKKNLDAEDDAEEYSDKVKQRIAQMKKAWHDERRAKEAAVREREEAVRVAQQAYIERQQYQKYLEENEAWAMSHAQARAKAELDAAKREYRDAYESGDTDRIIEAQATLQRANYTLDQINGYKPRKREAETAPPAPLQPEQKQVYRQPEPPVDERVKQWADNNRWFMKDPEMTNFALGVHQKLVQDGVSPQSEEYYERIDARMRQVFPDKFKQSPQRQSSTVVAPVGRSPRGKKVVLTKSQVAVAKQLGITPEQYAKELVRMEGNS